MGTVCGGGPAVRLHFIPFAFLLVLSSTTFDGLAQTASPQQIERVVNQLARNGKGLAIYAYLQQEHPQFVQAAQRAGLADLLDGQINWTQFSRQWSQQTGRSSGGSMGSAFQALGRAMQRYQLPGSASRQVRDFAAGRISLDRLTDMIGREMWDAPNHRYAQLWSNSGARTANVHHIDGDVLWFNPDISIPELGIRAGQPLTAAQERAVVRLFGVEVGPGGRQAGTGFGASHMGRAIASNSFGVTLLTTRGTVKPDAVIKGVGSTGSNTGGFNLDLNEAIVDAEFSRALYRAGGDNYDSLLVIRPRGHPSNALYVRIPRTLMRHEDIDTLASRPQALRETLERHLEDVSAMEGRSRTLTIKEWAQEFLPRRSGRNAGLLDAFGVPHPSSGLRSNHGLAETVDWGGVRLGSRRAGDKTTHWNQVESSIQQINTILPANGRVSLRTARVAFEAGFREGKTMATRTRSQFKLRESGLQHASNSALSNLLDNSSLSSNASRAQILQELRRQGFLETTRTVATRGRGRSRGISLIGPALALGQRSEVVSRAASEARAFGRSFGLFGAGYLVSEALHTIEDSVRAGRPVLDRWTQMANLPFALDFTKTFAAFSAGASTMHHGLRAMTAAMDAVPNVGLRSLSSVLSRVPVARGLALAAGMAVAEWVRTGKPPDPARLGLSVGSFMLAGALVKPVMGFVARQLAKRFLFAAAGPVGWALMAVDLGLTLYLGQSMEELVWNWIQGLRKPSDRGLATADDATSATLRLRSGQDRRGSGAARTSIVGVLENVANQMGAGTAELGR